MTSTSPAADPDALAALPESFRHPHVTRFTIEPHPYRPGAHRAAYAFTPFTGTEPRPERPEGLYDLDGALYEGVSDLYNAMLASWAGAQFTAAARDYLTDADTAWQTWTSTEQALTAVYGAFDGLADGTWRASRMALHDLQDTLLGAAADFDGAAGGLARLQEHHWDDMRRSIGEVTGFDLATHYQDVAATAGISTEGWQIGDVEDYRYSWSTRTLTARTKETVAEQNERLDRAAKDISAAGEGVLALVDGIRGELETVRGERDIAREELVTQLGNFTAAARQLDQRTADLAAAGAEIERLQEKCDGLADDVADRAFERDLAKKQLKESTEASDALLEATANGRDNALDDLAQLRTQRTVILVCAAVLVIALLMYALTR
ncbi:hypothetical protein [Glycomyces sp. MUSA5-2]|uniref:hypothetical protein n=1 Tax=Glycomyces sp. MUSA5-2 TaxID=2053002 RepID=UPI0030086042